MSKKRITSSGTFYQRRENIMTILYILLALSVIASGLFTGLLVAVVALLQQTLKPLSASEFATVMRHFLPVARKAPANYALVLTPILLPPVVLALAWSQAASPLFILTLVGWLAFLFGPFLTSMLGAEPLYDVILGWPAQSPPVDWQTVRDRYFRLNLVRLIGSGSAFLLFLLALNA
jgi:hypothetical protein